MRLPLPLSNDYDYRVPDGMSVAEGDLVEVPFGVRHVAGVIWGPGSDSCDDGKLKPLARRFSSTGLDQAMRNFVDWVADYTVHSAGAVLRMVLSVPDALAPQAPAIGLALADPM